jgi:hypothetical protein
MYLRPAIVSPWVMIVREDAHHAEPRLRQVEPGMPQFVLSWRKEGLGPVRSAIARSAHAPTLFVRRGTRPGALAPRSDITRFTWSAAAGAPAPGSA